MRLQPGGEPFAGRDRQRDGADLISLAVQAGGAAARGDRHVGDAQALAFFGAGSGAEQEGDEGVFAGSAAVGGAADRVLLCPRQRVGCAGFGDPGAFDRQA